MKKILLASLCVFALSLGGWAVTVNQSGSGDFTTIQAAIDSGASEIVITDSAVYQENLEIGDPETGGPAVTLTSNQAGDNRPVITPSEPKYYVEVHRSNLDRGAGFGLFSNGSTVSNLIIEGQPDMDIAAEGLGALFVMADNAIIENCLFRPAAGTERQVKYPNTLLFFAQEGEGGFAIPGGRDCDGCIARDCEFVGVATDGVLDPTAENLGYLQAEENGQAATLSRMDHFTNGDDCTITYENCNFHHSYDAGIFPSNRGDGAGSLNVVFTGCRFDSFGKFAVRTRGANVTVECSVFTRTNQGNHGDGENCAIAIQNQDGHRCTANVSNTLFVNCGGAYSKSAYFGGCNNHNSLGFTVDNCTFVACNSGVSLGTGSGDAETTMTVNDSIFHNIGYNTVGAVDYEGFPLTADHGEVTDGLYPTWEWILDNSGAGDMWSAAFNYYKGGDGAMVVNNCLVGEIASEDTRTWQEIVDAGISSQDGVLGARLYCGIAGDGEEVQGLGTVIRDTPVFANTDLDAEKPYELAPGSPGQGLGIDYTQCGTGVADWSVY